MGTCAALWSLGETKVERPKNELEQVPHQGCRLNRACPLATGAPIPIFPLGLAAPDHWQCFLWVTLQVFLKFDPFEISMY